MQATSHADVPLALSAPLLCLIFSAGLIGGFLVDSSAADASRPLAIALAAASGLGILFPLARRQRPAGLFALLLALALGFLRGAGASQPATPWAAPPSRIELRGTVDTPLQTRGNASIAIVRVDATPNFPSSGRIQATLPPLAPLEAGDRVVVIGTYAPTDESDRSGASLLARGIVATTSFPDVVRLDEPAALPAGVGWLQSLRRALESALDQALPQPQAGLASGLLVGATGALTDELRQALIGSGTTHLVVVSGYNISLVAAALIVLLRGRPWLGIGIPFLGIWAFTLVAGASPPSVRAAIMATVLLAAIRLGRGADPLAALALAATGMLALAPSLISDLGFQLSALATIGLIALQPRIASLMPGLPGWAREPLAATLAAQLATLPVLGSAFHQISAVAPLSNALAALAVPVITVLAAIGAPVVLALPAFAPLVGALLIGPTTYLLTVIEKTASVPHALVATPQGTGLLPLVYGLILIFWAAAPTPEGREVLTRIKSNRKLAFTLAALPVGAILGAATLAATNVQERELTLALFDAGGAHALFGRTPLGRTLLLDGGRSPAAMTSELGRRLGITETQLDLAVLTTADGERLPGMVVAVERYPPRIAIAPDRSPPSALQDRWRTAVGPRLIALQNPTEIELEAGLRVELLPTEPMASSLASTHPVPTLAVRLVFGETAVLFAPLADAESLRRLARQNTFTTDVLIAPRGGSQSSVDADLLARMAPRMTVLPVDHGTRSFTADPEVLDLLGRLPLFRSDLHGTVEIRSNGSRIWVHPERGA